jgi:DNA-binding response OmpR family regulator
LGIEILKLLIGKKGALVTKEELFTRIWDTEYTGDLNTLYTNISFIRDAIELDPANPRCLHTVRGKGYRLDGK